MAAPTTIDEFLKLVRKSALLEESKLDSYVQRLEAAALMPNDPRKLAGLMVRDGLITFFQAEQFLLGKWRGFAIGKYKLLERIGFGGMGQVFLCEHVAMRRRVAIKVLPPAKAEEPASLGRFYREARAAGILDHPNIVRTHDVDQDGPLHFLVMEYVDGSSFLELVKKAGPLDVLRACHYIRQSAEGLAHAHHAGLIHRDIKPGNILVDREGLVKILDMGLARFYHEDDLLTLKYDEKSVLGTADYVAPEQTINSHEVDIRADIYGLGCTFYFLLAGHPPFPDGTVAQKLLWHQNRMPTPIRQIRPEVPEGLAAVLDTMLAKDVTHRFQTPDEVAEALVPWTQTPIPPPPESEMPKLSPLASAPPAGVVTAGGALGREPAVRPAARTQSVVGLSLPDLPPVPSGTGSGSGVGTGWPAVPGRGSGGPMTPFGSGPPVSGLSPYPAVPRPGDHGRVGPSDATPVTRPASLPVLPVSTLPPPAPFPPPVMPSRGSSSGRLVVLVLAAGLVGAVVGGAAWFLSGGLLQGNPPATSPKDGRPSR